MKVCSFQNFNRFLVLFMFFFASLTLLAVQEKKIQFDRDIRPILSDKCYACHGPDAKQRQGNLRLDTKAGAFDRQENPVIIPHKPSESLLIQRINAVDTSQRMPPASYNRKLSREDRELLAQWIEEGAAWEDHWLYNPPSRPLLPKVKDKSWLKNEVDSFVLNRLENETIAPSPRADRSTLIRRLSFDLTGLPPDYTEVKAFIEDKSPDAYEKVVDQLLASPHYGERMALYWLDLVRYADTTGYHSDEDISIWPYRDYVIQAFNENMPFDQFTRENLAGDLLENPTTRQKVAAGYNRLNQTTAEGGAQAKEYLSIYSADRVRTTASVWMGATMSCAQCHDHKFDPYTIKDFYRFSAFFADIREVGVYGGNSKREPIVRILDQHQQAEHDQLTQEIKRTKAQFQGPHPELSTSQTEWQKRTLKNLNSDQATDFSWVDDQQDNGGSTNGKWQFVEKDKAPVYSGQFSRLQSGNGTLQHYFQNAEKIFTISDSDMFFAYVWLDPNDPPETLMLQFNDGDWNHRAFWGADKIRFGRIGSNQSDHRFMGELPSKATWIRLEVDPQSVGLKSGSKLSGLSFVQFGGSAYWDKAGIHTTVANQTQAAHPKEILAILQSEKITTKEQKQQLSDYYRTVAPELKSLRDRIKKLNSDRERLIESVPYSLSVESVEPRTIRVLPRGNWMDDSGSIVTPDIPHFLPSIPQKSPEERLTRLDLANWLVSGRNPMTARVFVNRLWYLFFGTGISKVLDDLGAQGESPFHPELLDWLAVEFVDNGWDIKHLVKKIVSSQTYQQVSAFRMELKDRDPFNRLLARQSRFRFSAEVIRDNALAISGLLVRDIGGPSVKPYQPKGYYANLNFPKRVYQHQSGEKQYRRGIYTHWQRTFPHPSMMAFDAPTRQECTAERPNSNTPIQALTLLNDPSYVESARVFAEDILNQRKLSVKERINWAFQRALSRPASLTEQSIVFALFNQHQNDFEKDKESAQLLASSGEKEAVLGLNESDLAAWTSVARTVLNLHEVISRQ